MLFRPVLAAIAATAVLLVAVSLAAWRSPTRSGSTGPANVAASGLSHTGTLLATLTEADTTARRYVLTGETLQLEAFEAAQQRFPGELARVQQSFMRKPDAPEYLATLANALTAHFALLEEVIASAFGNDSLVGLMLIESDASQQGRDEILTAIRALEAMELTRLAESTVSAAKRAESIQALNAGLIVFLVTLTGTGAWLLFRRVREIEGLITVCAWTRQVRWKGHWMSFEEYLAKRFRLHCTHGICEEAANKLLVEAEAADSAPPFPADSRQFPANQSASPFAPSNSPFPNSNSPFPLHAFGQGSASPFSGKSYTAPVGGPPARA